MGLKITVKRSRYTDEGVFGTMRVERNGRELLLCTGELPWRGNRNDVSCVPAGVYQAVLEHSPHFDRNLWELKGVPNRAEVKIHNGTWSGDVEKGWVSQVLGCILIGVEHGALENKKGVMQRGVKQSKEALRRLMEFTAGETSATVVIIGDPVLEA